MIGAVAFCPHPPLLVPQVAQAAAPELADVRAACVAAIRRVAAKSARLIVVGAGHTWQAFGASSRGCLAGFGVPVEVALGSDEPGEVVLPLSLTIGAWLVCEALGPNSGATGFSVGPDTGAFPDFASDDAAVGLVVMGDGSARRSTSAPGYYDERAAVFDARIAEALRSGAADLLPSSCELGDELLAGGTRVWNAVAGLTATGHWQAELLYDAAPYGVGYFVAVWT